MNIKLHGYWRSGAAYRVRIALALKGIAYESAPHDLRRGEQHKQDYLELAPIGLVPAIELGEEDFVLTQSVAILEWLEERFPLPALLSQAANARAVVRSMCAIICCDTHPLNNLRVLNYLGDHFQISADQRSAWITHWIDISFQAMERMIEHHGDGFAFGASPTLADCCLLPQVYSARRFQVPLTPYPRIASVERNLLEIGALAASLPENQADADKVP